MNLKVPDGDICVHQIAEALEKEPECAMTALDIVKKVYTVMAVIFFYVFSGLN